MRKILLAFVALVASVGLTLAAPVRFVKYDEKTKEITVKTGKKGEDQVEKTYTLTDKVKFVGDDDKEIEFDEAVKKFTGDKAVKGFDLTLDEKDDKKVEKIKFAKAKKGKGKDKN